MGRLRTFLLSSILLVIVLIAVIIYNQNKPYTAIIYNQLNKPYTAIINSNWSIKLPKSYKTIYSTDSGASFNGDGKRYHVFEYRNKEDVNLSLRWEDGTNESIESAINVTLNEMHITKENMPDFKEKYRHYIIQKDFSEIDLIFVPGTKRLYVIENIQ